MPLVIAGGHSVTDYPKEDLTLYAKCAFTIGVNGAIFDFPCDVCIMLDPINWFPTLAQKIKELNIPVVCRPYPENKSFGLDLIEIGSSAIHKYPLSGMAACKLSDAMSQGGRPSYVLGIDATDGNYKGYQTCNENDPHSAEPLTDYEKMGLSNTINLSMRSRVSCWPKLSKLPKIEKVIERVDSKLVKLAWIRANAKEVLS